MDLSLLPLLRETKEIDADSALMKTRISLAIFGYAHIRKQTLIDYDIDIHKAAEDFGWDVKEGFLLWSINMEGEGTISSQIQFGKHPSKRELKEIQDQRRARSEAASRNKAR